MWVKGVSGGMLADFEKLMQPAMDLFQKTMKPVKQVLKDANVKNESINDVQ